MKTQNNLNPSTMKITLITGIFAMSLALTSCQPPEKAEAENLTEEQTDSVRIYPIKVLQVAYSTFEKQEVYTATINAWQEIHLGPNQPNRIEKINVEVGDRVKKGDLLVKMDETTYMQTKLQFNDTERDYLRMDTLLSYGSTSQQAYDKTKMGYEMLKVTLKNMEENVYLRAPFNGIITGKYFNEGEIYSSMSPNMQTGVPSIISLMQINELKVIINVSERYWPVVKKGMKATLSTDIYPGEYFAGKVQLIHPTIDPTTKTFAIEILIPNDDEKLRPGMFAKITLNLGETKGLFVPSNAVLKQQGTNQRYVFLNINDEAKKTNVEIGKRFNENLEIISGLNPGDQLIITGNSALMTGSKLKVVD
jgi:RND family efflux transporter MFP subunit